jgi:hypothetical protein
MPDLTMCQGVNCPQKIACYRYRAVPTPQCQPYFAVPTPQCQPYFAMSPVRPDGSCDHFMELRKSDAVTEAPR